MPATDVRRMRIQIYVDILRSIHTSTKTGVSLNSYRLERMTGLPHDRMKRHLSDLEALGFLEDGFTVSARGYQFLVDVSTKVLPVMRMYGLWHEEGPSR